LSGIDRITLNLRVGGPALGLSNGASGNCETGA